MPEPIFPPLLRGESSGAGHDPFTKAIAAATLGTDAGLVVHDVTGDMLRAAMVFAPECTLTQSMAMVFAVEIGFADALGALGPPEVGVHFDWPGGLRINGARCGRVRAAASTTDPATEPDWLVVGLELPLRSQSNDPGMTPEDTVLFEEGCSEVVPVALLESWARHALVWIHRWDTEGMAPLHAEWRSRAHGIGQPISLHLTGAEQTGTFMGLDEYGSALIRDADQTKLVPLTDMLED
ncbi:biotin/lipoate--protein ligase family protein [Halovulum sp. GXIMD14793]